MTPHDLMAAFDVLADAPDGVKRLRELVLSLAVRGKLVAQCQREGVAAMPGRGRRGRGTTTMEPPFGIPDSWVWCRLDEIATYNGRPNVAPESIPSGAWLLDLEDIEKSTSRLVRRATAAERGSRSNKSTFKAGDVLYGKLRPYLDKVLVAETDGYCTTEIVPIIPGAGVSPAWLRLSLKRPDFLAHVDKLSYGVKMPRLGTDDANATLHPLPPLAEQHRIVARVDELMGLLDRLDAARATRDAVRRAARDAALADLRDAPDAEAVEAAWGRIARQMHDLFTEPEDVAPLRQAIRGLALHGRLVPQDPHDEPAFNALERVQVERHALIAAKSVRRRVLQPEVDANEVYNIPETWRWARLDHVILTLGDGPHFSPAYVEGSEGVPFLSTRNITSAGFKLEQMKYVSKEHHAEFSKKVKAEIGDVLYTKGGTTGIAVVNDLPFEFSVWVHVAVLKVPKNSLSPWYLALALNSQHCYEQSQAFTHGIGNKDLGLTPMPIT